MKNLLLDILETRAFAGNGKSLLFRFPDKRIFFLSLTTFINAISGNGQLVSLEMVSNTLNNQRNQQSNQQQQITMT